MNMQPITTPTDESRAPKSGELPRYETPRIQAMSEKDILNTFQITQSMMGWWVGSC